METKYKLKPSIFTAPHQNNSTMYCPDCGYIMDKILHTPKDKKPIYQYPKCNTILPELSFGISDLF